MSDEEILKEWQKGYSKFKVAEIYKNRYNQQLKIIRLEVRNRHAGKFITYYEALARVEKIILKEVNKSKYKEEVRHGVK